MDECDKTAAAARAILPKNIIAGERRLPRARA